MEGTLAACEAEMNRVALCNVTPALRRSNYSSTGFDMLGILQQVATRPNPQVDLGSVDMSCSFLVTDARLHDHPIVYCSDSFERLTGYSKEEILGRNCRFLQSPDGNVTPGEIRWHVDNRTVIYLKQKIETNQEAQAALFNYRKGGERFTNLLTIIPITWDSHKPVYFVGFQADLCSQTDLVTNDKQHGSLSVNYQYCNIPRMPPHQFEGYKISNTDGGISQGLCRDVLPALGDVEEIDLSKGISREVLLQNTDDVVHVLSFKGIFRYCSPAIQQVLGYEPQELVGTALSSICHSGDYDSVIGDLRVQSGFPIYLLFRIRSKHSGFIWWESRGYRGRYDITLIARERPIYTLSRRLLSLSNGLQDNEAWATLSTSGMFLFVTSDAEYLFGHNGGKIIGSSLQAYFRRESRHDVDTGLWCARIGKRCMVTGELETSSGQFVQCSMHLFPGDSSANGKPTFLIAQIRLLKPALRLSRAQTALPLSRAPLFRAQTAPDITPLPPQPLQPTTETGVRSVSPITDVCDNVCGELEPARRTCWQSELRQVQQENDRLETELTALRWVNMIHH